MASTSKGGYDYEFVSTPPKSLECSICLLTLRDPHVISCCGNHYCQVCIGRVKAANKPCPLCNEPDYDIMLHKGVKREVNNLTVYCPQKAEGCKWTGEINGVNCHLNLGSRDSGCGYVMLECTHQCDSKFLRSEIAEHEVTECPNRPVENQLDALAAQMKLALSETRKLNSDLTEKMNTISCKNTQLEAKCKAIETRNEDLEARNVSLESKLRDFKAKVDTIESEKQTLKSRVAALETLAMKVFHVDRKQSNESHRLDRVEETVKKNKTELDDKCTSIEGFFTPTPPFYFTLCNFEHYQAVSGYQWQSPAFYTFPNGYKLCAAVYPHGTSSGRGSHISMYVSILRGEFDDQLQWPFQGSVSIDIFNYSTQKWDRKSAIEFEASDDVMFTGQPINIHSNPGLGFPKWVHLDDVFQKYCNNGMVRFRVVKIDVFSYNYMAVE